ncbi:MAG: hypothetical protein BGP16_07460 [Sphingobium sp. 66-54]|nr:MAG: hypothetical protein BGP16_07460 [Sphingobium sp. 66-54]
MIALAIHYSVGLAIALLIGLATGWWAWGARRVRVEADEPITWPPPHELPVPVAAPAAPALAADDLTAIKGIDAEIAGRLRELGVTRFSQIAGWLPGDIERIDGALGPFKGRLIRDEWIAQARLLARGDMETYHQRFGHF